MAKKLLPAFTDATGIKVEIDEMQYLRLKDAQILQMSKPKGDYDVIVYVIMWKTEYVQRKFLTELEPMFQNAELAMPDYDRGDIIKGYYEGLGLVGGPRGYLPGTRSETLRAAVRSRMQRARLPEGPVRQAQHRRAGNI